MASFMGVLPTESEFETIMFNIKVKFLFVLIFCLFVFWSFHKTNELICHLPFLQHFQGNFFFSVSSFDLGENQKRWVVIGICLNRLLLPVLRDFVGQEIPKHYASLKSTYGIDSQLYGKHMTHDGPFQLNYGSINNNWGNFKRKTRSYDYKVGTAIDLAKLYLEPHMAKFTGIGSKTENVNFP